MMLIINFSKPTNVRFVMMQHEEVEGVCDKGAQTLLAPDENNEKETQTDDQAMILDEAQRYLFAAFISLRL